MADYDPVGMLRVLQDHRVEFVLIGGVAARLRGAPVLTEDVDVTPANHRANLERLVSALSDLDARLRTSTEPGGVSFPFDAGFLESATSWTLATRFGDLDLVFAPIGTTGYPDLRRDADDLRIAIEPELIVSVASLADVIRSKEAAGREKDRASLPLLRRTLEESEG
ncbi:MAG: hypothetical protein R6W79_07170 [Acidimicrobiia bacterium]